MVSLDAVRELVAVTVGVCDTGVDDAVALAVADTGLLVAVKLGEELRETELVSVELLDDERVRLAATEALRESDGDTEPDTVRERERDGDVDGDNEPDAV